MTALLICCLKLHFIFIKITRENSLESWALTIMGVNKMVSLVISHSLQFTKSRPLKISGPIAIRWLQSNCC